MSGAAPPAPAADDAAPPTSVAEDIVTDSPASRPGSLTPKSGAALRSDVSQSIGNALKLGMSLLGTWAVALLIRMTLPRFLGPEAFGQLQFADGFSVVAMVVTWLGVETYIRKEVPTRQDHASDFIGGTMLVGIGLGIASLMIALPALRAYGQGTEVLVLVSILGCGHILLNQNNTLSAVLHATGKVDGLAVLNIAAKVAWGGGIGLAFLLGYGPRGVAVAFLCSEILRLACLVYLTKSHASLQFKFDRAATKSVIVASAPYYFLGLAQTIYARIDVTILSFLSNYTEVGWYGAAATIASMSMLLSPLISWVILPLTQRAAARSHEELMMVSRRALELILVSAFPVTLAFFVSAPIIVPLAFGPDFIIASHALKILAPTFVLTYAAIVCGSLLIRMGRGWVATWISVAGMVIAPLLNLLLVPKFMAYFGPGGAGMGAATCLSLTELFAASAMMYSLGLEIVDRRTITVLSKTLVVGLGVIAMDHFLIPIGAWRLPIDGLAYVGVAILVGAIDVKGLKAIVQNALAERRNQKAGAAA